MVPASFVGRKSFSSNLGFPNNDGYIWKNFQKKKKGNVKYKCVKCEAFKVKVKTKQTLRQSKFKIRYEPIVVQYEKGHSKTCVGKLQHVSSLPVHRQKASVTESDGIDVDDMFEESIPRELYAESIRVTRSRLRTQGRV